MKFHRSYDLTCIREEQSRDYLQHAIDGVNLACSESVDAWLFVIQGLLFNAVIRPMTNEDRVPRIIFDKISEDKHTDISLQWTLNELYAISQDYENWRLKLEEANSKYENSIAFWNDWSSSTLATFYRSKANRLSAGPILTEFLTLNEQRNDCPRALYKGMMDILGSSISEQLNTLAQIIHHHYTSPSLVALKDCLMRKQISYEKQLDYSITLIKEARANLAIALESKNPVAIRAAMNPGWLSVRFTTCPEYLDAVCFMNSQ